MNENYEPCMELNEIIYDITGEFWKQAYEDLLRKQKVFKQKQVSPEKQSITDFRKQVRQLAKENQLKFNTFSHNEHIYMSLVPLPIYIGVEKGTGDFSVSVPHINTKHFTHSEYAAGLQWIQDYIDIDISPLRERTESVREKFYINQKSSEIISASINAICKTVLDRDYKKYTLNQTRLRSEITLTVSDNKAFKIIVYHKPFTNNSELLISLLKNPHELLVEDKLSCFPVDIEQES